MMFLGLPLIEWFGYFGSLIVVISLMMSSILKLRLFSLFSSVLFIIYATIIKAYPITILNFFIFGINAYHLIKIYRLKESFELLPLEYESSYFQHFLKFYQDDIKNFFPDFSAKDANHKIALTLLRNMLPIGIFIADRNSHKILDIKVDYVIPSYRDFKMGKFLFKKYEGYFKENQIEKLISTSTNAKHMAYLKKMGFKTDDNHHFIKTY